MTTESRMSHQVYEVEVWNPTFNHELLNEGRVQALSIFLSTKTVREFTPQAAAQLFPRAAIASMEQTLAAQGSGQGSGSSRALAASASRPTTGGGPTGQTAHQGATEEQEIEL